MLVGQSWRLGEDHEMTYVDAIYDGGVFKPLEPVVLQDQQRVRLTVQPIANSLQQWLQELNEFHDTIVKRVGILPDSTPDIAADRLRMP
jgi:predicted DNA-binding antitoxin AbrB/MazE fold protein